MRKIWLSVQHILKAHTEDMTSLERALVDRLHVEHLMRVAITFRNFAAPLLLISAIPIYLLAPEPQRWIQMGADLTSGFMMLWVASLSQWQQGRWLRPYLLLLEAIAGLGYALCLHVAVIGRPDLSDIGFLSSLYVAMMIFNISMCPYPNITVLGSYLFHVLLGALAWSGGPHLRTLDFTLIVAGSGLLAVTLFYSRIFYFNREKILELRSHELLLQNEKLKVQAIELEVAMAKQIHESFDPPERIETEHGFRIRIYQSKLGLLGGDWMATRTLPNGDQVLLVADATGKGMQAALVIHAVQSLWASALHESEFDPLTWIAGLNRTLWELGKRSAHTMTLGLVIVKAETVDYYSCGHIPLFILCSPKLGEYRLLPLVTGGDILGLSPEATLHPIAINLAKVSAEAIFLATDGVFDQPSRVRKEDIRVLDACLFKEGHHALDRIRTHDDKMLAVIDLVPGREHKDDSQIELGRARIF